jgi:hypothetical protein
VFPARYELKFYILFRRNSVSKGLEGNYRAVQAWWCFIANIPIITIPISHFKVGIKEQFS